MKKTLFLVLSMLFTLCIFAQDRDVDFVRGGASHSANLPMFGFETVRKAPAKLGMPIHGYMPVSKQAVPMKAGDGTTLFGEVVYSTKMDTPESPITWGLYSFPATAGTVFTEKLIHNTICANGGGAYRKGKLHFVSYYEGYEPGSLLYLYFCTLDVNTLTLEKKALPGNEFTSIGLDMTYDPVGDMLYMQAYPSNAATAPDPIYTLSTMNIETGKSTPIADMDRMSMIVCDISGNMYGVRYKDGMFCKIDKSNARVTEVGSTGVNPQYNGSATFDYKTCKLYWSTCERMTGKSGIYEIDITTGKATLISLYPNNEQVTCLYIPQDDEICQLGEIPLLEADFSNAASTTGTVTVQAPSVDANGQPISGNVTMSLYIDNKLQYSKSCAPGEKIVETYTLTNGEHVAEAIATHPYVGKSPRKSITIWVGTDGPAAVENLKATVTASGEVTLTWDNPTTGAHGGVINTNLLYYEIRRMPGDELVIADAVGNSYVDKISNPNFRYYTYTVTGFTKGVKGASASSNRVSVGEPAAIPYLEPFDTFDAFKNNYLVYNENKDDGFWGYNLDHKCLMYKYDTFNRADDWVVSPAFRFEASQTYKLKFKARSESRLYPEELEVWLGNGSDAMAMTIALLPKTELNHQEFKEYAVEITVPTSGVYFIGFHAVTQKGQYYIYLDDVAVENGPSAMSPGVVTDLKVSQTADGSNSAVISFTTPSVDARGAALASLTAVKIFRNATLINTINNPGIGKPVQYVDNAPVLGYNTYKVVAVNENGEGKPIELKQWVGPDAPMAPTNVVQTTVNGKDAVLTWTAPVNGVNGGVLNQADVTYNIYDKNVNLIKSGVTGTTYTDTNIDLSKGQNTMFYFVAAVTAKGESDAVGSNFITYGEAYKNTFNESFAGGKFTTSDWLMTLVNASSFSNEFYGRYWGFVHSSKFDRGPIPTAQDGDNGYLIAYTDLPGVSSRMLSPKINVSGLKNPVLTFWFYHYFNPDIENGYSHVGETMTVEAYVDGKFTEMLAKPIILMNGNGWYRYDIKLTEFVGAKDFQIAFKTNNYLSYDMHIDNISITDAKDYDLAIGEFDVPSKVSVGSTREMSVTVYNRGAKEPAGYSVEFLRDGKVLETVNSTEPLAFAAEKKFSVALSPAITESGKTYKYSARVVYSADEDMTNNVTEELRSEVPSNNLPVVNTLRATAQGAKINLTWDEPLDQQAGVLVNEGFEGYEAFTITNMGAWTLVDGDKQFTYTIQNSSTETGDYVYPNAGEQMAFQVFNPSAIDLTSPKWTPYLGNQMAVCFAAAGQANNDWLISPTVKGGSMVTLMAKSVTDLYGLEKFNFCYSSTTPDVASFTRMGDVNVVPAGEWTRYEFTLPANAKYFAINCVSYDGFALLIDDVTYESEKPMMLTLKGFNVYRDGVQINKTIVEEGLYVDTEVAEGSSHTYNVTVVYDMGESGFSNTVSIKAGGVNDVEAVEAVVYGQKGAVHVDKAFGKSVEIYNVYGQKVYEGTVDSEKFVFNCAAGVYVVRIDGKASKVSAW